MHLGIVEDEGHFKRGLVVIEVDQRSYLERVDSMAESHLLPTRVGRSGFFFFFFVTLVTGPKRSLSLNLSDKRVNELQIRAHLVRGQGLGFGFSAQPDLKCISGLGV